ncbi:sister chromatid cohesion protein PDS5 homolog A-like isoform X3 [Malania oleifera]|uniref:sister chromatid cohesion protein PDS5 homolog A-like isoform X3 n=1 Tax=Malania oleifera TaxID=397392 RepID=UPI0025AEAA19|nr:sister chromatid cohesion protein PDS5 homolog A-like isoform X3 [Malania oleifera]
MAMDSSREQLQKELVNVGNSLLGSPAAVGDVLILLDKAEIILSRVEQSPDKSMVDSFAPLLEALTSDGLLKHSSMDVKVSAISCLSEITRITAPTNPFDDEIMKTIFQLMVAAFEKLSHVSGRCYSKAVSILQSMATVRSCLVMLDLECDALVVEMFHIFLRVIRSNHPHAVFSSMVAIMSLVLEESEEISMELLSPILASNVSPASCKLGEKVIENCADTLKPYLIMAMQSTSVTISDYSPIVVSICQNQLEIQKRNVSGSGEHLVDKNNLAEILDTDEQTLAVKGFLQGDVCLEEVGPAAGSKNDDKSPSKTLVPCQTKKSRGIDVGSDYKPEKLGSMKAEKVTPQVETVPKKRGRKPNSLMNPDEGYDHSWISGGRSLQKPQRRKRRNKEFGSSPSEDSGSKCANLPLEHENDTDLQAFSPKTEQSEIINSHTGRNHPKTGLQKKKRSTVNQETNPDSLSIPKGNSFALLEKKNIKPAVVGLKNCEGKSIRKAKSGRHPRIIAPAVNREGNAAQAKVDLVRKNESGVSTGSEGKLAVQSVEKLHPKSKSEEVSLGKEKSIRKAKSGRHPRIIAPAVNPEGNATRTQVDLVMKNESGVSTGSEGKLVVQSVEKLRPKNKSEEVSLGNMDSKKSRRQVKSSFEEDVTEGSGDKKLVSESATKPSNKDGSHSDGTPKRKAKRRRTLKKEESYVSGSVGQRDMFGHQDFGMPNDIKDPDENLIGCRIKVWWPMDQRFYEGVVYSFDHTTRKHQVLYADGDEEILNLKKEHWRLIAKNTASNGQDHETGFPSFDVTSDVLQKKAEPRSEYATKLPMAESTAKRVSRRAAPANKSKKDQLNSAAKSASGSAVDHLLINLELGDE